MFHSGETTAPQPQHQFASVAEAVDAAKRALVRPDGPLVLLDRVEESAADCPYRRPCRIYACSEEQARARPTRSRFESR